MNHQPTLELRYLIALVAVASERSFGRAADRLGYTQSAVSQQIAALERSVGLRLIERPGGRRPVDLTEAGERLARHAERIVSSVHLASAEMASLADGRTGRLRVGMYQSIGVRLLPGIVSRLAETCPDLELETIESGDDRELLAGLAAGELDLSFIVVPVTDERVETLELRSDPYCLVVPAITHDSSLEDPELERGVRVAAALAQENERLAAELRAQAKELCASRARIVEAGLAERRRLERDLHDGAQQRLVSLVLGLRMIEKRLDEDPVSARGLLEMAGSELEAALRELRDLSRGIHPVVLSDRGLDAALETLAGRAPLPVELKATIAERLPEPVELTVYFVVSEALTNVAKHAHASQARVRAARHNGRVVVEVSDDGVGGADPARGSGLSGLADRLSALDGKLEVRSERGQGTVLRAELPY